MTINWRDPDALDSHVNEFDKLRRGGGLSRADAEGLSKRAAEIGRLAKRVARAVAETSALAERVDDLDRKFAEVESTLARIELNRAACERAEEGFARIRAAVNASPLIGVDGRRKAADRGELTRFLN
jgi:hypothetical protein